MVQAARSGKQNIAEGSMASATSKKFELKLVGVARASLEELLIDYQDFLRQRELPLWDKGHAKAREIRALAYSENRSYTTYKSYVEASSPEVAANTMISLIHQTNYSTGSTCCANWNNSFSKKAASPKSFTGCEAKLGRCVRLGVSALAKSPPRPPPLKPFRRSSRS